MVRNAVRIFPTLLGKCKLKKISNPKKWKTELLYDSAIPLLGINLKDSE